MSGRIPKLILVVCVTVLIWVWADEALTRETSVPATLAVDKSTSAELWVNFDLQPTAQIRLRLSGPASKIDALERRLKEGTFRLEFFINPAEEKLTPGTHPFKLLPLMQNSRVVADLGLQVESTSPETINIEVVQLAKQKLTVQVSTDNQMPLPDATVVPTTVEMWVPQNWNGEKLKATVMLTQQEIVQAREGGIVRKPTVELAPDVTKTAEMQVKITLPTTQQRLEPFVINGPNIGYVFSPNFAGKYRVDLVNQTQVLASIKIQATDEAKSAYEGTPYKILLNINEGDEKATGEIPRPVIFNLPDDYVRKGEISVAEPERIAKFKLIPAETPQNGAVTAP